MIASSQNKDMVVRAPWKERVESSCYRISRSTKKGREKMRRNAIIQFLLWKEEGEKVLRLKYTTSGVTEEINIGVTESTRVRRIFFPNGHHIVIRARAILRINKGKNFETPLQK
ncbi:hypothetical protein TESG_00817 [Trichophyton tonsurans CBS 112818]|uniref:Uncharacterized protein n=2 Tax=Trichophyton TaxID=5550 RepID=F2Q050_TRIEC|nr:hypothetical protein TESG_00817 [Trichophyton tonsurans CBS 112818]EGE07518.1 hypothetical protein TEQG_06431 [Trichophyton equinum CBS 127.97]